MRLFGKLSVISLFAYSFKLSSFFSRIFRSAWVIFCVCAKEVVIEKRKIKYRL